MQLSVLEKNKQKIKKKKKNTFQNGYNLHGNHWTHTQYFVNRSRDCYSLDAGFAATRKQEDVL